MSAKIPREEVLRRIKEIHGDKIICDDIQFNNLHDRVDVTCYKHGDFKVFLSGILQGSGCKKCVHESISLTLEQFIQRSKIKHGEKFDYDLVAYVNHMTKVIIKCNKCLRIFEQVPNKHLAGQGCPYCVKNRRLSNEMFIQLAQEVHGIQRYTYQNTFFVRSSDKIIVTCPIEEHGNFKVTPSNFLKRRGCPICKESYGEKETRKWLNSFNINFEYNYRFDDCRFKKPLPFDFFLPQYNCCIEYQGIQHYGKTLKNYKMSEKDFEQQNIRDDIKRKYCNDKGIKLIIIPYWDLSNIESILIRELNLERKVNAK